MNKRFSIFLLLIIYKSHSPEERVSKGGVKKDEMEKSGIGERPKKTN